MKAVFFVYVWPEPRSSAAGLRTYELAAILQSAGYEVHAFSPCAENAAFEAWQRAGVICHHQPANDSSIAESLSPLSPELVIFDRFVMEEQFGWRARQSWPGALHVVDTQDLHSLRRAREKAAVRGNESTDPMALLPADWGDDLLREMASLHRADACFVVSPAEKEWLLSLGLEATRVLTLPFSAATASEGEIAPFSAREGFCFLGNFRHPPNLDGTQWLVKELWPRMRERIPKAQLYLYGAYPPASISCLDGKRGVHAVGFVHDHRAALSKHRVLLAPLRFGAGIKGKVLEAYATGTPVAGTGIAFEGIESARGGDWVEAALELHENETAWNEASRRSLELVRRDFSPDLVKNRLLEFLESADPEAWRSSLVGRMLRLQQNNATKYFSLWIEAKNKK